MVGTIVSLLQTKDYQLNKQYELLWLLFLE